ncbi:hypothetical protein GCM10023085_74450 [Actinomadura viridis]|uniref:Uncharacterized protein n=1 Tax=Actinomadura viridis TaxID=58110 RepID=A0A931DCC6_9ACTN|nr:hypothetical protein [Actinomadura viridis]MBG6087565.1 hypothetical protein [Actinomadura viridis]
MAADRRLALHAALPERYARHEVLASTIDHRGRLIALVAEPGQDLAGFPWNSRPGTAPRYDATAVVCAGSEIHQIPLAGLDLWFNRIDALGDGVVLAASSCEPTGIPLDRRAEPIGEDELHLTTNIRVFDADGAPRSAFYAGDAIKQLVTDARGDIWSSYSDQSSYWFPNPDGTRSYGFMIGLACWDEDGSRLWMPGSDAPGGGLWDCYSLNVGREVVHTCPYADFPLIELDARGIRAVTPNPVAGGSGLAVSGREIAFFRQGRVHWRIHRARREDEGVVETGRENLVLPGGRLPSDWGRGVIGRDGKLWLREAGDERRWYRYEIDS